MAADRPSWAYYAYAGIWKALDALFPPRCVGCGRRGERWCATCQAQVPRVQGEGLCPRCGHPLAYPDEPCPDCRAGPSRWAFERARAWALYEGMMREVVRALKYRRRMGLGESLARALAPWARALPWPQGCVVPIPLAPSRHKARGYNQVVLVARPLAWQLRRPFCPRALRRLDGPSQVGMTWQARWRNVRDAFRAEPDIVRGRVIWLTDDVMTTGATLHAAARALKDAGARAVYALTWARSRRETVRPARSPSPKTRARKPNMTFSSS